MVIYEPANHRCRFCGRRMLLWRWRWAHRRCATTRMAYGYEPPSLSLLLPRQELDRAGAATIPPPATSVPPPPHGPTDAHPYQEYNAYGRTPHQPATPSDITQSEHMKGERAHINNNESARQEATR